MYFSSRSKPRGTMASRRHVVSTPELASRGFRPVFGQCPLSPPVAVARVGGPGGISRPTCSSDTAVAKGNSDPPPPPPVVGISSASHVDVVSSRGASIGTEAEMDALTDLIERVANEGRVAASDADSISTNVRKERNYRRRRLLPPECVFPGAYVTIRFRDEEGGGGSGTRNESNDGGEAHHGRSIGVTFDATSALAEWAEAHGPLPAPEIHQAAPVPDDVSTCSTATSGSTTCVSGVDSLEGIRGVAIMRSVDAQLWSEKGRGQGPAPRVAPTVGMPSAGTKSRAVQTHSAMGRKAILSANAPATAKQDPSDISLASSTHSTASSASDFRYDWTFSTPYGGTVNQGCHRLGSTAGGGTNVDVDALSAAMLLNGRNVWSKISASGIDLSLLSDRTQPILFYDDVNLYEDDLHDNGVSHLNAKVRVMPKCLFVLCRLFVRVDYVTIRVRDVRVYHRFGSKEIFRDFTWRECRWDNLVSCGLPDDVGRWRVEDATGEAAASIQALLGRLPEQSLPTDIPSHSKIELEELVAREG
mmetsp:Transcript_29405/g.64793  ORF Transcript_29405/g.64793 Transcript_29405/m.64793 type:complete len:532 (-) Transcript_29405:69-1664(-)